MFFTAEILCRLVFLFYIFLIRQRFALVKLILKDKKTSKQKKEIVKKTICTPCPSASVGCAWWLSRLIILLKVFSRFQRPINEKVFFPHSQRNFIHGDFWKGFQSLLKQNIFSLVIGLLNDSATWLLRFCFKSSVMDT